ncbi:MAG: hypothetical protein MUF87_12540 [Anaerolineae bacterium]|nr:hypothetical protein [Anaerolineae bacterium]
MFYRLLIIIGLILGAGTSRATTDVPPNYVINLITADITNGQIEIEFGVTNIGGASNISTQAELVAFDDNGNARVIARETLRPLNGNTDRETLILRADAVQFPANSQQIFRIQIASLPGQPAITSDTESISLTMTTSSAPNPSPTNAPEFQFPDLRLQLNFNAQERVLLSMGIIAATMLLLLLLRLLWRLLFSQPVDFTTPWQPPYATMPQLDPYSVGGVRQAWQPYAQNNTLTATAIPNAYHVTKHLIGTDGVYLSGWQIMAMRLVQYDQFGRVSRSQTLARPWMLKRLNRLMQKNRGLNSKQLERHLQPIAKRLIRQFYKKITRRSAMLPIALDVRLKGTHGEVNIFFELYQFQPNGWLPLDRWQPEMIVTGKTLHESYTFTLYGQTGNETLRQFRQRLPHDLTRVLSEFIGAKSTQVRSKPTSGPIAPDTPTTATTPSVPIKE